ncbi:MAG: polymer-forming cytoskeletal protein [Leptospirales bacterium]
MAAKKEKLNTKLVYTNFHEKSSFNGILEFGKPLKISGKFTGEIRGNDVLLVDRSANIEAHIDVVHLVVLGKVVGNVIASKKVELKEGSSLIGNIRTPNLEIDDGVVFEGQCEMKQAPVETTA